MPRFAVGIDLGTTNSALASAEITEGDASPRIEVLPVPQLVELKEVAPRTSLPSALYLPNAREFPAGAIDLPWTKGLDRVVGTFARDHGAKVPGRLVASAKSWLSHDGVDRRGPILPFQAPDDVPRVSPVDASAAYLTHLRDAWNAEIGAKSKVRLEDQDVTLTVPASFDPAARQLTEEAAQIAGLKHVTLLEEPQAAFYAWLAAQGDAWRERVKPGDLLLVCDVGGGTTDFTLILVEDRGGDLGLRRVAVGEHILLGGDNMDLAIAHAVAATTPKGWDGLDAGQRLGLTYAARQAKEELTGDPSKKTAPVTVLGRGSRIFGGGKTIQANLTRATLDKILLDGFFPEVAATDAPSRARRMGLAELGLPFASDPAITRHLAHFLARQAGSLRESGIAPHPTAVLFNGGVFQASGLRDRVVRVLSAWAGHPVPVLGSGDLDLAVARGAAFAGLVRAGRGVRIRGGVGRAYYVGVETAAPAVPGVKPPIKALCVVPLGMEEGSSADVPGAEFGLAVGEPAEFRFLGSTTRRDDVPGTVLDHWTSDDLEELAPIEATLAADADHPEGRVVPVRLQAVVTEVGTLELWCQSTRDPQRWKLEYNVRS